MQANAHFLTTFGTDTSAPRWPFGLNLLAFCLNSVFCAWRSGPPAAGVGLRENCHLGAFFFPRASLFSTFLRTLARSACVFLSVIVFSWLAVHFHVFLRAGPARAGSRATPTQYLNPNFSATFSEASALVYILFSCFPPGRPSMDQDGRPSMGRPSMAQNGRPTKKRQ